MHKFTYTSPEEAVKAIKSNDHVFVHSAAAAPKILVDAMSSRAGELKNVTIYQIHTEGEAPYARRENAESFTIHAFFVGANMRKEIQTGKGSYIPVFLSEIPRLFRQQILSVDVALISVSPPDKHGFCSLGPSIDTSKAAVEMAKVVIAQVNRFMPRTHGEGMVHINDIDFFVEGDIELYTSEIQELSSEEKAIGKHVASLIEDGSTLQMGIGAIPNAVLACLENHRDLGIHSEMISDGILPLIEKGVINGKNKKKFPGTVVASFALGSRKLYDFMDDNPMVRMIDCEYVNNTDVIRKNPKMVAINSAIEIDLTGQVCADSIGCQIYSGVGGQMDFIRGASLSEGGKPIIAMTSTTRKGDSKIVPFLKTGAGVVTTRAHVHYVVTEYGIANLYGKTIEERVAQLIGIAHPKHRESLWEQSKTIFA